MKKQVTETPRVEEGKVIAERLNGYAAFVGCWALIGAYLTTGQIIPGVVWFLAKPTNTSRRIVAEKVTPKKLSAITGKIIPAFPYPA